MVSDNPYGQGQPGGQASTGVIIHRFGPGQVIYNVGDPAEYLFFIQRGDVTISLTSRELVLNRGDVFGDAVLGENNQYRATAIAGNDGCECLAMPYSQLRKEFDRSPPMIKVWLKALVKRLVIAAHLLD